MLVGTERPLEPDSTYQAVDNSEALRTKWMASNLPVRFAEYHPERGDPVGSLIVLNVLAVETYQF